MRIRLTLRNRMFMFFSLVLPFVFFFFSRASSRRDVPRASLFSRSGGRSTVMGSFWGLSATGDVPRTGHFPALPLTPVTASDILASSVVANYVLVAPTVLLEFLFARYLYHVVNFGDLFAAFIMISIGNLSFASLGLVVASVTNTMQETQVINQLLWLPLIFLSGATFPLAFLPQVVQKVSLFLPATYLVQGLQAALFNSTHIWSLGVQVGALAFWGILTFFLSTQLFRWEPEVKVPRRAKLLVAATAIPFLLLGILENKYGNIPAQAQSAFESLTRPAANSSAPSDAPQ